MAYNPYSVPSLPRLGVPPLRQTTALAAAPLNNNKNVNYDADQTSVTVAKNKIYTNLWKIEDFARQWNAAMTSAVFSGVNCYGQQLKWTFTLDTHFVNQVNSAFDSETLYFVKISCVFDSEISQQNVELKIENDKYSSISGFIGKTNLTFQISRSLIIPSWLSPDGSLALRIRVTLLNVVLKSALSEHKVALPSLPSSTLVESLANLLQSEQFADLTITAGQQSFRAHKNILVARSTVFAAMFQHDMKESQRNEITITDVEPKVFEEVLRFIYTDKVQGLPQMAHELLAAADKYDLARLKVMCEIQLFEGISAESATKTLLFADLHRAKELKARTIQFLSQNLEKISNWEQFCSARPDLMAEILKQVVSRN